jgi:hypothetical protein
MIFKGEERKEILPAHRKLPNSEYSKTSLQTEGRKEKLLTLTPTTVGLVLYPG